MQHWASHERRLLHKARKEARSRHRRSSSRAAARLTTSERGRPAGPLGALGLDGDRAHIGELRDHFVLIADLRHPRGHFHRFEGGFERIERYSSRSGIAVASGMSSPSWRWMFNRRSYSRSSSERSSSRPTRLSRYARSEMRRSTSCARISRTRLTASIGHCSKRTFSTSSGTSRPREDETVTNQPSDPHPRRRPPPLRRRPRRDRRRRRRCRCLATNQPARPSRRRSSRGLP